MQSSPSGMPSPELAPSRQRSPTVITVSLPPESVPMMEAPPPTSVPSPITTPAEMRPSTIEAPERAGVEVDEALVHDRRALGQMRAQPDAVGVGDAHAGRHHVVDHARELVDAVHRELLAARRRPPGARLELVGGDRPGARPGDVREQTEDARQVRRRAGGCGARRAGAGGGRRRPRRPARPRAR